MTITAVDKDYFYIGLFDVTRPKRRILPKKDFFPQTSDLTSAILLNQWFWKNVTHLGWALREVRSIVLEDNKSVSRTVLQSVYGEDFVNRLYVEDLKEHTLRCMAHLGREQIDHLLLYYFGSTELTRNKLIHALDLLRPFQMEIDNPYKQKKGIYQTTCKILTAMYRAANYSDDENPDLATSNFFSMKIAYTDFEKGMIIPYFDGTEIHFMEVVTVIRKGNGFCCTVLSPVIQEGEIKIFHILFRGTKKDLPSWERALHPEGAGHTSFYETHLQDIIQGLNKLFSGITGPIQATIEGDSMGGADAQRVASWFLQGIFIEMIPWLQNIIHINLITFGSTGVAMTTTAPLKNIENNGSFTMNVMHIVTDGDLVVLSCENFLGYSLQMKGLTKNKIIYTIENTAWVKFIHAHRIHLFEQGTIITGKKSVSGPDVDPQLVKEFPTPMLVNMVRQICWRGVNFFVN